MIRFLRLGVSAAVLFAGSLAFSQQLRPGMAAPEVRVSEWVKGKSFSGFGASELTVVEFWSITCGPCVTQIPHLSELARKYQGKGVTFYGVSVGDPDHERQGQTRKFVAGMGDKMGYNVALDTDDAFMEKGWLAAAGIETIPTLFVVDKTGKILWIHHDAAPLDGVIDMALKGKLDLAASSKFYDDQRALQMTNVSIAGQLKTADALCEEGKREESAAILKSIYLDDRPDSSGFRELKKATELKLLFDEPAKANAMVDEMIRQGGALNLRVLRRVGWAMMKPRSAEIRALATRAIEAAIRLSPPEPMLYYDAGYGWLFLGEKAKAWEALAAGEKLIKAREDYYVTHSPLENLRRDLTDFDLVEMYRRKN
jgi:thiol-disulfide isomerase/thioredoxin